MRLRVLWRRLATAAGIYGSALLGILATVVAARDLSKHDFARFALVFAATGLLQTFLDLTVDEVVVKYGNRYAARSDWGRFRRLFEICLRVKMLGGLAGTLATVGAAFLSPYIWTTGGVRTSLLIASLIPLVQAPEGMAEATLLVRNRYDVRSAMLLWSMLLRLAAVAVGARIGLVATFVAIVVAQVVATTSIAAVGLAAYRRWPRADATAIGEERAEIRGFAVQSTVASGLASLRALLPTVLVGVVARPLQVGEFRIAQAPQTAMASLSAPVRLVLLAEQTRDVEHGRSDRAFRLLRRYIASTVALAAVGVPALWFAVPPLVRAVYGARWSDAADAVRVMLLAAAVQLVFGWTKSFPVSIGRPGLRTAGQLVELATLVPLVCVLGHYHGAVGAAAGVAGGAVALAAFWTINLVRLPQTIPVESASA
ncbi:MAG TPA: lipopolysaccharide biosynthesis protein [Gaiellaceae bacterium]|nr:lipopolysaccharide biosynthesis protein [Gaiellaceae bacterium]